MTSYSVFFLDLDCKYRKGLEILEWERLKGTKREGGKSGIGRDSISNVYKTRKWKRFMARL